MKSIELYLSTFLAIFVYSCNNETECNNIDTEYSRRLVDKLEGHNNLLEENLLHSYGHFDVALAYFRLGLGEPEDSIIIATALNLKQISFEVRNNIDEVFDDTKIKSEELLVLLESYANKIEEFLSPFDKARNFWIEIESIQESFNVQNFSKMDYCERMIEKQFLFLQIYEIEYLAIESLRLQMVW